MSNPTGKNQYVGRGGSNFVVAATKRVRGYSPAMLKRIASLHASMLKGNR